MTFRSSVIRSDIGVLEETLVSDEIVPPDSGGSFADTMASIYADERCDITICITLVMSLVNGHVILLGLLDALIHSY